MTKKPTVTTLQSGFNSTEVLNENFESIRDAFDNTLSLDGSTPNAMQGDLDLNGNNLIGATGLFINGTDYLADVEAAKAAALVAQAAAELAENNAETAEVNAEVSETAAGLSATAAATSATAAQTARTAAELAETNAGTSESNAVTSAINAATSETNASTSASTASTKASEAATSATNAATSATEAETAKTGAETARDSALAALDSFDDRYLGVKTADPTVDNDGDALAVGAIYFNSTTELLYVYNGTTWQVTANAASGDLVSTNNLSDLTSAATARTNLGLGTNDSPTFAGLTTTANVSFGDNDKATFGAGSDLQIYHNGGNSYIEDVGTGDLVIKAGNLRMQNADGTAQYILADNGGAVQLRYNGGTKLATTSTGVDVTGTVTADGMSVGANNVFHDGYHPNADKWTTARTLSLTGDASGSTSWDGSANATLSVTVNDDSHTHKTNKVYDARADGDVTPDGLPNKSVYYTFTDDIAGSGNTWDSVINVAGWDDGYTVWQLMSSSDADDANPNLYFRRGRGSTWGSLQKVWTDNNDGSGSGLDADTVDGYHESTFMRKSAAAGSVGSYMFANNNSGGTVATGTTVSGSTLRPTSAGNASNTGYVMSGTWRLMGHKTGSNTSFSGTYESSLWLRVS